MQDLLDLKIYYAKNKIESGSNKAIRILFSWNWRIVTLKTLFPKMFTFVGGKRRDRDN